MDATGRPQRSRPDDRPAGERRRTLALAGASIAAFLVALDLLAITTALGDIGRDLGVSATALQWTVTGYGVAFASLLLTASALGERIGRRRTFTIGLATFGLGSVLAAIAPGIEVLVAGRIVQGVGGAIIVPMGLTIVTAAHPPERRGAAIGTLEGVAGLAVIAGPLVGGGLTELVGWQGLFWVNVPIIAVGIPFMRRVVEESFGSDEGFDPLGLVLSTLATGGAVWALVRGAELGWARASTVLPGLGALLAAAAFVWWERRAARPLVPAGLVAPRDLRVGLGVAMLLSGSIYGVVFFMAQFLQVSQGATPWGAAWRLLPWTATLFLIAPVAGRLADRVGARPLLVGGLGLQAVGFVWLSLVSDVGSSYTAMLPALVVGGVGTSAAVPVSQLAIVQAASEAHVGRAVGITNTLQEVGGSLGVALAVAGFGLGGGGSAPGAYADGFRAVTLVGAALAVVGAGIALGLQPKPSRRPVPATVAVTAGEEVAP